MKYQKAAGFSRDTHLIVKNNKTLIFIRLFSYISISMYSIILNPISILSRHARCSPQQSTITYN